MNSSKRLLSLILALLMIAGIFPLNVFAAVEKPNWQVTEEEGKKHDFWPLSNKNEIVRVSGIDPVRNPSLNYDSTYVNEKGRQVIRLEYSLRQVVATGVWHKLLLKIDPELYKLIDWQESNVAVLGKGNHASLEEYTEFQEFSHLSSTIAGTANVKVVDLRTADNNGIENAKDIPIELVLVAGKSLKDLSSDPLVQMRLMDEQYKRVYSSTTGDKTAYSSYTFSTSIPIKKNYTVDTIKADLGDASPFNATNVIVNYSKEDSTITVIQRQQKSSTLWDSDINENLALRLAFDTKFANVLKSKLVNVGGNPSQVVAEVFLLNAADDIRHASTVDQLPADRRVEVLKEHINTRGDISFIEVGSDKYKTIDEIRTVKTTNDFVQNILYSVGVTDQGYATAIRFHIDPEKLKGAVGENFLAEFPMFVSFVRNNPNGSDTFEYVPTQDKVLAKGSKIKVVFDQKMTNGRNIAIQVGQAPYALVFDQTIDHLGSSSTLNSNYGKEHELTLSKGITLKAGEPIRIVTNPSANVKAKIIFNNDNLSAVTTKDKVNSKLPKIVYESASLTTGIVQRTKYNPKVNEIFTDTVDISGHTYYPNMEVRLKGTKEGEYISGEQMIKYSNGAESIQIEGKNFDAFKFSFRDGVNLANKPGQFILPVLKKDMPLSFTARNIQTLTMEGNSVVEQVQAKIIFDTLGVEVDKYNTNLIEKIAPLNKNYTHNPETGIKNPEYKYNGFEPLEGQEDQRKFVDGVLADHNGESLKDKALEKRQFPKDVFNKAKDQKIIGWTTKKLTPTADQTTLEQFEKIKKDGKVVRTVENWSETEAYIFDEFSPIAESQTVYAVWGPALRITLHSNNVVNSDDEITYSIPISSAMFQNGNVTIGIPQAPYINQVDEINKADNNLKSFVKDDHSFVGWMSDRDNKLIAGISLFELEKLGQISQGELANETYKIGTIDQDTALPNGYKIVLEAATYEELVAKGDIDLYAEYRPYYNVEVEKRWRNIRGDKDSYEYVDNVEENLKKPVKLGLLWGSVRTKHTNPTIDKAIPYSVLETYFGERIKSVDKNNPTVTWTLPGYDTLGQRRSYIAVEVTDEKDYNNFKGNWVDLGINIFEKTFDSNGNAIYDPNTPVDPSGATDPDYTNPGNTVRRRLSKVQSIFDGVDAYSGATTRTVIPKDQSNPEGELKGYHIDFYNIPRNSVAPRAILDTVFDGEKSFNIEYRNKKVEKVEVTLPGGQVLTLTKDGSGNWTDDSNTVTIVTPDPDKLTVTLNNGAFRTGEVIQAKNFIATGLQGDEISGEPGDTTVLQKLESNKVIHIEQKENPSENEVQFSATVPKSELYPPQTGTVYQLVNENGDVLGEYIQKATDLSGDEFKFPAFDKNKVTHGEKLYVVTKEDRKTEVRSEAVATVDIKGPIDNAAAEDETFRRYINITGNLNEIPKDTLITLEVNTSGMGQGDSTNETKIFENIELAISYLNELPRNDDMPTMWLSAVDEFGNESVVEVKYNPTYQFQVQTIGVRAGRNFFRIRSEEANATIIATLKEGSNVIQEITIENIGTAPKKVIFDSEFKKGQVIEFEGILEKDGKTYVTNPYKKVVE